MEIGYILLGITCYHFAPFIYEAALSLFFGWQYAKYARKHQDKNSK
jgi:hypothetical protein